MLFYMIIHNLIELSLWIFLRGLKSNNLSQYTLAKNCTKLWLEIHGLNSIDYTSKILFQVTLLQIF